MAASKTIIISVPRFSKFQAVGLPLEAECSSLSSNASFVMESRVACIGNWDESDENSTDSSCQDRPKSTHGRKRRLEHLSYEQKLQRKKLKNRVAAQSSRDRKKARMDELEAEVKELSQKCGVLSQHCDELLARNQALELENRLLKEKAELRLQTRDVGCSPLDGPAASPADPLPWGRGLQLAAGLRATLLICSLLSLTCSPTLTMTTSPSWLRACSAMWPAVKKSKVKKLTRDAVCGEAAKLQPVVGQTPEVLEPCRVSCGDIEMVGLEEALVPEVSHTVEVEDESVVMEEIVQEADSSHHVPQITDTPCSHTHTDSSTREAPLSQPSSPLLYSPSSCVKKSEPDSDYESLDSPHQDTEEVLDFWCESFVELFPSLV